MLRITKGVVVLLSLGGLSMQFVGLGYQLNNSSDLQANKQFISANLATQISVVGKIFHLPDFSKKTKESESKSLRPKLVCPPDIGGLNCGEPLHDPHVTLAEFLETGAYYEDFCEGEFSLSHSNLSDPDDLNYCSDIYSLIRRRYTLTDECGYSKSCLQRFFYNIDEAPPTADCSVLEDVYVGCDDHDIDEQVQKWIEASSSVLLANSADNCKTIDITHNYLNDVSSELNCESTDGMVITFLISDACAQGVSCQVKILPRPARPDLEQPHDKGGFNCLSTLPSPANTIEEYIALGGNVEEHCGKGLTISHTDIGDVESIDICSDRPIIIRRRYTVKDGCGNTKSTIQRFEFQKDTEAPTIDCGTMNDFEIDCDKALLEGDIQDWIRSMQNKLMKTAIDNCGTMEVAHNYTANSAAKMNCNGGDKMIVNFSVSDRCGNTSFCEATIISSLAPQPVQRPEVICVDDLVIECGGVLSEPTITLSAFEAAGGEIVQFCDGDLSISSEDIGSEDTVDRCSASKNIMRRRYIIHDDCGNEKRCLQRIIFEQDIDAPSVDCDLTNDLLINCDAEVSKGDISSWLDEVRSNLEAASTDYCGEVTITNDYQDGNIEDLDCENNTELSVTYLITDPCGNATSCAVSVIKKEGNGSGLVLGNRPTARSFDLFQNNPNPFEESTSIRFKLERSGKVRLTIYDVNGKLLFEHNKEHNEGMNNVNITRDLLSNISGVVFYALEAEGFKEVKSMIIME